MSPHTQRLFTPPPLSRSGPAPAAERSVTDPVRACRTPLVYWPAVTAAALLSLFALTGLLAWLASHPAGVRSAPQKALAASTIETKPVVKQEVGMAPLPRKEPAPASVAAVPEKPAPPLVAVKESTPPPVVRAENPVAATPPVAPAEPQATAMPDPPNPLEPEEPILPPLKPVLAAKDTAAAPTCPVEHYGTSVDFLNNPQLASRQARTQAKLVFLLHVSGNFEDNCFT